MPFDVPRESVTAPATAVAAPRVEAPLEVAHARTERISALDGLRGLMAWAVAVYHFGLLSHAFRPGSTFQSVVVVLGLHAVEAFFIVSGFCLFHLHGEMQPSSRALRRFYLQRFLRLAPVFYLVIALNVLLHEQAGPPLSVHTLLENLTFVFGLHHPNHALVVGGWSIGLEVMFYACFPLLAVVFRAPGLLAAGALAATVVAWSYSANSVEAASDASRFNAYVLMQNHAFAFLLGGVIAKLRARTLARLPLAISAALLFAAAWVWVRAQPSVIDHFDVVLGASRAHYVIAAVGCVTLAVITRVQTPWLRSLLEQLGELSYPVYLLHPLAWVACSAWLPAETRPLTRVYAALLTTLVFAALATHVYDRPIRSALGARWLERRG